MIWYQKLSYFLNFYDDCFSVRQPTGCTATCDSVVRKQVTVIQWDVRGSGQCFIQWDVSRGSGQCFIQWDVRGSDQCFIQWDVRGSGQCFIQWDVRGSGQCFIQCQSCFLSFMYSLYVI